MLPVGRREEELVVIRAVQAVSDIEPRVVRIVAVGAGDGAGAGAHRDARRQRRRIRPVHGRDLHVSAQQELSAVRHQPSTASPRTPRGVSPSGRRSELSPVGPAPHQVIGQPVLHHVVGPDAEHDVAIQVRARGAPGRRPRRCAPPARAPRRPRRARGRTRRTVSGAPSRSSASTSRRDPGEEVISVEAKWPTAAPRMLAVQPEQRHQVDHGQRLGGHGVEVAEVASGRGRPRPSGRRTAAGARDRRGRRRTRRTRRRRTTPWPGRSAGGSPTRAGRPP